MITRLPTIQPDARAMEIERLQDRVEELTRVLAGRSWEQGPVAGLSIVMTMLVSVIAKRGRISKDSLAVFMRENSCDLEGHGSLKLIIHRARPRLAVHGVTVTAISGFGWEMDTESRRRWAQLTAPPVDLDVLTGPTDADAGQRAGQRGAP